MFATYISNAARPGAASDTPNPGDLVLVDVPLNCTIHSADAARLARLRVIAAELARSIGRYDPANVLSTDASLLLAELLELGASDAAANELLDRIPPGVEVGVGVWA